MFKIIALPTRPQPDTIVAIFILKEYGKNLFPGIESSSYKIIPALEAGKTEKDYLREGIVLLDIGGGLLDHHKKPEKTTASRLVAALLEVANEKPLQKLLAYAERDDFYGKGTQSADPLDRAFGLSGLIAALNKTYPGNPEFVIESVLPLIKAHHHQECQRVFEIPKEIDALKSEGKFEEYEVLQKKNKLKVCFLTADNVQLAGFLRAADGGRFDVVVQERTTKHVNILTRPMKRPDLRSVAELVRAEEYQIEKGVSFKNPVVLRMPGRNDDVPNWYFDPATNSLQNGGVSFATVPPTKIPWDTMKVLVKKGLLI